MTTCDPVELPRWERSGPMGRAVELAGLAAAPLLLVVHMLRLELVEGASPGLDLIVVALALLCADFVSGLVHWIADTWGSDTWPVVGPRLLRPFRLHHVNPGDLLRRDFIECNGDVAVLAACSLTMTFLIPIDSDAGRLGSLFFVALAAWILPTNQVHQWAHQPEPARVVQWAQDLGLILGRSRHAVHHVAPFDTQYCILTGWCNRPLGALGFFPALESAVAAATGLVPRADDQPSPRRQTGPSADRA